MDHRVLGVIGASGGLGVSTLAVALAVRAVGRVGATVAVDGAPGGGALDVTACVEHVTGLRWADLVEAEGNIDGAALLRELPAEGSARVLAGRGPAPPDEVVRAAVSGLSRVCGLTVVDLGCSTWLAEQCSDLLLVVGSSARQLADGAGAAERLHDLGVPAALVLRPHRGDALGPEEVAAHLDLPLAGIMRDDPRVPVDADRGRPPGSRGSGALAGAVDSLLSAPPPWLVRR
ncbi:MULTISPECIES: hypothetical protein [unclassified Phycicoccus]|uniref:hypothetical protein n=1 Tax=unclassified Phycicoccus TaxID=2637926 RepID=UPI000A61611C|nr:MULTISPECIES: hypothetical protein [unclassified Phycicoccus]